MLCLRPGEGFTPAEIQSCHTVGAPYESLPLWGRWQSQTDGEGILARIYHHLLNRPPKKSNKNPHLNQQKFLLKLAKIPTCFSLSKYNIYITLLRYLIIYTKNRPKSEFLCTFFRILGQKNQLFCIILQLFCAFLLHFDTMFDILFNTPKKFNPY